MLDEYVCIIKRDDCNLEGDNRKAYFRTTEVLTLSTEWIGMEQRLRSPFL